MQKLLNMLKILHSTRAQIRARHRIQAGLHLFREAGENHRDMVARMLAAGAGDDDPRAVDLAAITRRLQGHRHLRPLGEGRRTAKLDAILVNDHRVGRKGQAGLSRFEGNLLQRPSAFNFSRAHTAPSE